MIVRGAVPLWLIFDKTTHTATLLIDRQIVVAANGLLITSYDNLSIYQQRGSMRRLIKDEQEWNRTSDYQSVNECFVVEDYDKCAFIENLVIEA